LLKKWIEAAMKNISGLLPTVGALAILACSAVSAGGLEEVDPPPILAASVVTNDWSGFYVGLTAAKPTGDNNWDLPRLALKLVADSWSGTLPILTIGHDWQRGRLTFGAAFSLASGEITAAPQSSVFFSCFRCNTVVSDLMTLRGRVGVASGRMHYFVTGGFARADVAGTSGGGLTSINSETRNGWTLGLGIEHRLGEKLSLTASYDHTDLGSIDLSPHVSGTVSDIDFGLIQLGLNYRW